MSRHTLLVTLAAFATLLLAGAPTRADVVITEIMYHPSAGGPATQWIEIYNNGSSQVTVNGWRLRDATSGKVSGPIGLGGLDPGAAAVIVPWGQVGAFQAAWDPAGSGTFAVAEVMGWSATGFNLGSDPSAGAPFVLQLLYFDGSLLDQVSYDDEGAWPSDDPPGASIYLLPSFLTAGDNDDPANWARAQLNVDGGAGADENTVYSGDTGSPGAVATGTPDPDRALADLVAAAAGYPGLLAKLGAVQRAMDRGQSDVALRVLGAFDNEVAAQSGKKLPADVTGALLAGSARLRAALTP